MRTGDGGTHAFAVGCLCVHVHTDVLILCSCVRLCSVLECKCGLLDSAGDHTQGLPLYFLFFFFVPWKCVTICCQAENPGRWLMPCGC